MAILISSTHPITKFTLTEKVFDQATEQVGKQLESLIAFKANVQVYSIWNFVIF
jgi:hypothetical protein